MKTIYYFYCQLVFAIRDVITWVRHEEKPAWVDPNVYPDGSDEEDE